MNKIVDVKPNYTIELPADLLKVQAIVPHGKRALRNRNRVFEVTGVVTTGCFKGETVTFLAAHDDTFKIVKRYSLWSKLLDLLMLFPTAFLNASLSSLPKSTTTPQLTGPMT